MFNSNSFFPLFSSYIYHLVNDVASLRYTTLSVLRDFARDGVVYLELRTTPRAMPAAGLTKEGYIQTILDAIAEHEREQSDKPEPKLRTKLILSVRLSAILKQPGTTLTRFPLKPGRPP